MEHKPQKHIESLLQQPGVQVVAADHPARY